MKNIAFFFLIVLSIYSCSKTGEQTGAAAPAFENEQMIDHLEYSIKYPGNWQPANSGQARTEFLISAPQLPGGDPSSESVHLIKRNLEGKSLAEFIVMTMDQYQKDLYDFEILSSANNEFTFLGGPVENKVKYRNRFYEKNGVVYILGFSSGLKDWSAVEGTADKIMESFQLK
jgi:hypothetical protein